MKLLPDGLASGDTDAADDACEYTITVHTSDIRGAGTDANVFIELHGDKDGEAMVVGQQQLETAADNFERGKQVCALLPRAQFF